ncbi:4'-phosphopantetheinyl transferase superfamily protein [Mucilaginibacter sp. RS28]|uniref:4'-phosphopantetheinyl transferase superfamily protein n=1 Tax=Mucilaginibacter straminoryzae TaxID=2932774 RepID=A0A9X1X3K7_9SPHI|nr:4'-phosphopantetheinyl transferase superfamily protein [Mucilaginibacter straminoryzae]MCJ8210504.1 4'-phosphopantetheinyl transferase superfamily protein [Mucilaginibacter straminoryzae]
MISVGNDIVDLHAIDQSRTSDPRFYPKILSATEQQLYQRFAARLPMWLWVWLLWSAKEAVYKYLKRHEPTLVFSPAKIVITEITGEFTPTTSFGEMVSQIGASQLSITILSTFQNRQFTTRSCISNNCIATFLTDDFDRLHWGIEQIAHDDYKSQSAAVRAFATKNLSTYFTSRPITIKKSTIGYPEVYFGDSPLPIPLSFAHHGNYVSYAFLLERY